MNEEGTLKANRKLDCQVKFISYMTSKVNVNILQGILGSRQQTRNLRFQIWFHFGVKNFIQIQSENGAENMYNWFYTKLAQATSKKVILKYAKLFRKSQKKSFFFRVNKVNFVTKW